MSRDDSTPEVDFSPTPRQSSWWIFALIGLVGGFLSGMFGVGGGIIMVPALVIFAGFTQRMAAGTSLAAIIPTAAVGSLSYALTDNVDWLAAVVLAVGAVLGAQLGSFLLSRLSTSFLLWVFVGLQATLIVSLWIVIPIREQHVDWNLGMLALLVAVGLFTGILSGMLGVGGGLVVVPILISVFGASDLIAKGTSLVMMIPGALSGTIANSRRGFVHLRGALIVGIAAALLAPFGAFVARAIDPRLGNILLALLLTFAAIRMVMSHLRSRRTADQ
jgi:uncharacterized membrane protein YfcA